MTFVFGRIVQCGCALQAVRYVCARMHCVPLVMPSKFDQTTRQHFLTQTAGVIKLETRLQSMPVLVTYHLRCQEWRFGWAVCYAKESSVEEAKAAETAEPWPGFTTQK